uniref:ATP synthase CF0 subunit II n=1 Tax=Sphondylothamnion multifidum TaxID=193186 RepID=A0A4D6X126_9FLOR|nr:ATP synthase CF0 subunit II [Sphondylothamnion multifidum]
MEKLLFLLSQVSDESKGGLFDFNATLPLMALQFLALTVILNLIFYKPITKVLDERDEYIRNSLTTASASLLKANELTQEYENQLAESRKKAQFVIKNSQQEAQLIVSEKIQIAQQEAERLLADAYNQLNIQKEQALKSLESQVDILSDKIRLKLLNI